MPIGRFNRSQRSNNFEIGPSRMQGKLQEYMNGQGGSFRKGGLESLLQRRGIQFPGVSQGSGVPQAPGPSQVENTGSLGDKLNVQTPPKNKGGIKDFLNKFKS